MSSSSGSQRSHSSGAVGLTMFASALLIMGGVFQFLAGLAAIVNDTTFVVGVEYIYKFDTTTWGWIHMLLGILLFFGGFALLQGAVWARTVVVILAGISAVANFLWLPYQPWWSIIILTLDVFVIWAVTVHGRDIADS
jgi:hypothetical protein